MVHDAIVLQLECERPLPDRCPIDHGGNSAAAIRKKRLSELGSGFAIESASANVEHQGTGIIDDTKGELASAPLRRVVLRLFS